MVTKAARADIFVFGISVTRFRKREVVEYKRPQVTGVDLAKYRSATKEDMRITVQP